MMNFLKSIFFAALSLLLFFPASAQDTPHKLLRKLDLISKALYEKPGQTSLEKWWDMMKKHHCVPYISGDSVVFFYYGKADSVRWQGDFTGWGYMGPENNGKRVGNTDLWYVVGAFPRNARLDYKIVLNGKEWILDPANPYQQWGGAGPNSELRMPEWKPEPAAELQKGIKRGKFSNNLLIQSASLGYSVSYRVYTPLNYKKLENLPVIYVTDGHEYAGEKLGGMVTTLDNLIGSGRLKPMIAVFIDPRDPANANLNRREQEFLVNEKFLTFVTKELVPHIDNTWKTNPTAAARAILGTSFGGVNAAYFGAKASDTFHKVGIHSPAFWARQQIFTMYEESPVLPLRIYMSTGTIADTQQDAQRLKAILEKKGYELKYQEVNEGHSWGNWRALIDDVLLYLWN